MIATESCIRTIEERALDVLAEFVTDVDGAGLETVREDWPDLVVTYARAREALRLAGRKVGDEANLPPRGNARPGDRVHWRADATFSWRHGWKVEAVGLTNEGGHPLDILITDGQDARQVSPFDLFLVMIEPPAETLPARLREFLAEHGDLVAARRPVNVDYFTYFVACRRCMSLLDIGTTSPGDGDEVIAEEAVFMFDETLGDDGAFCACSPVMDDGVEEGLHCDCRKFEEPHDVER